MSKEQLIDLDKGQLELLVAIIGQCIPHKQVWAYGSRVSWKAGEYSDLDLAVFDCDAVQISNFKEALEESDLLMSVDVMDWENIKKNYVALQENPKPEGWREVKLGDVCEIVGGGTPKTNVPEYWDGDIPWLSPPDFTDSMRWVEHTKKSITKIGLSKSSARLLEKGDVIISARGTVGALAQLRKPMAFSQTSYGLKAKRKYTNNNFLFYLLKSCLPAIQQSTYGAVFDTITMHTFDEIEILLPPLPEQKAIAEILSSLDDKIDLLHRQNKTLENLAQTLFRQWFVKEANPEWEVGKISDEFDFTMGQSPPGNSYNEAQDGIPMFQGNADFGFRFPKNRVYTTEPKRLAEKYDTLISVRAPVGEQNMAKERCCIGRGVAAFRYKRDKSFYSYTYFRMMSLIDEIKQFNNTGTVFGAISKADLEDLAVTIPPDNAVDKVQMAVKPIDDKIISNQAQIRGLENLRDTLLPKLMNGVVKAA